MSGREIQDQNAMARDYTLEPTTVAFCEAADTSLPPLIRVDSANLMRVLRQLEGIVKRQAPRIAIKAKGKILFLDVPEIVAVQAEGRGCPSFS